MSDSKTTASELSVAFGILELDPLDSLGESQLLSRFGNTLDYQVYLSFCDTYRNERQRYTRFFDLGLNIRRRYGQFRGASIYSVRWNGPEHESSTVSLPIDLIVANTPISVKDESDVIYNRSPYNMLVRLPQGYGDVKRSDNWFVLTAPDEYQYLYEYAQQVWGSEYPADVTVYHATTSEESREEFRRRIKAAEKAKAQTFQEYRRRYEIFCNAVAQRSAAIFNEHYLASRSQRGGNAVNELVLRNLLRLGDVNCIICGVDKRRTSAVEMPSLSDWLRNWRVRSCEATIDTRIVRKQPVIKLILTYEHRTSRRIYNLDFRVELRWSHGRFCGNPEAKLYKEFQWNEAVPFVTPIYTELPYRKIGIVGDGGFAVVFEAIQGRRKRHVALKELSYRGQDLHETERFAREVEIQSALKHGNILPILDSSLDSDPPWSVMPLAQNNLSELVEAAGGLPVERTDAIFKQILAGVAFAHSQKVVHRDLKPENILIFSNDEVKVSDFGLGKQIIPGNSDLGLTGSSESLGSWYYAAPEQMRSFARADYRSDIYSLGKILYFCLTGKVPYPDIDVSLLDHKHAQIVEYCTKDDPDQRYHSVDAILSVLNS